jgi:hypothetical protein
MINENEPRTATNASKMSRRDPDAAIYKRGMTKLNLTEDDKQQYLNYKPIQPDLVDFERLKTIKEFAIKNYKDSIFRGALKENMRHGKGVITYTNTRVYEGDWRNDKRDGKGYERFSNGNTYIGDYVAGQVDGQGRYVWSTGEFYEGEWKKGLKDGYGVW